PPPQGVRSREAQVESRDHQLPERRPLGERRGDAAAERFCARASAERRVRSLAAGRAAGGEVALPAQLLEIPLATAEPSQPSQPSQPSFQIEKIYVKDLSLELPNAPQ